MDDKQFEQEGTTLKYKGDVKTLPHCKKCTEEHDLMTQEHPYKLVEQKAVLNKEA